MTTVFLLTDNRIPDADKITEALHGLYDVRSVNWDTLVGALPDTKHAVVFFHEPLDQISIRVSRVRSLSSSAACIAVTETKDPNTDSGILDDCDILLAPFSNFDVLNRTATNLRLSESRANLEDTSQHDEVTTLYNRRYFMNRLNSEISLSKRHLSPLSVVVFRLNFYQVYLDSFGYDYVVELFKHVATVISEQVRQEDIVARVSDDEVAMLLPRSTEKGAKTLTSRILKELTQTPYVAPTVAEGESEELSAHAGIAGYPIPDDDHADADSLLRYARHALHQARCSEKSLVKLFSEITPVF